jgi:glucose/arabinose dehydrogenase
VSRRRLAFALLVTLLVAGAALLLVRRSPVPDPAAGFADTVVLRGLREPLSVAFAPDGRVFVAEKHGTIRVFARLGARRSTLFADLGARTFTLGDRGLFGLALDPDDGAVYVLYTFDGPVGAREPLGRRRCPELFDGGCVVSGRLSRIERGGRETVLVSGWCQQFPSHGVGDLLFGEDGTLYASGGEGASYERVDTGAPGNVCDDPPGEGGSLRAQDPGGASGAVIAVDVSDGSSRVAAYGLRNPFRFVPRPASSELWIGDVGSTRSDELDVVDAEGPAMNFGWPCYEGDAPLRSYDEANVPLCERLYAAETAVAPVHMLARDEEVIDDDGCGKGTQAISGLAFYRRGSYPSRYRGALFFADYVRRCIWVAPAGDDGRPDVSRIELFRRDIANPVTLVTGPGGDLFYLDFAGGALHRLRYVGSG